MKVIDCRNLACPAPVINVKKALEEFQEIQVVLDDGAPRENVTRFARNRGYQVTEETSHNSEWILTILAPAGESGSCQPGTRHGNRVILITSDRIGNDSEDLGRLLMKSFIHTLLEVDELPTRIMFVNSGVLLTCDGSDVLEALQKLIGMGVEVFSCGLCLDFYKLKARLKAGSVTNMLATAENLLSADSVIKL
jgi:selenium metabolism protein YedF